MNGLIGTLLLGGILATQAVRVRANRTSTAQNLSAHDRRTKAARKSRNKTAQQGRKQNRRNRK